MTTEATTPESIAHEASQPGKFSLIDRLKGRNLPTEEVSIFIDDASEWERQQLVEEELELVVHGSGEEREKLQAQKDSLQARIDELAEKVRASEAVFTLQAVTNARYDELIKQSQESFPVKYEKVTNPLSGRTTLEPIASPDREELFNNLFMAETVTKVTMNGEVDDEITPEWVELFQRYAPLDALRVVTVQAYKMRMAGEWMDAYQNEDFSPTP